MGKLEEAIAAVASIDVAVSDKVPPYNNMTWLIAMTGAIAALKALIAERAKWVGMKKLYLSNMSSPSDMVRQNINFRVYEGDVCAKIIVVLLEGVDKEIKVATDALQKCMDSRPKS